MPYVPVLGSVAEIIAKGTLSAMGSGSKNVASVFHYRLALITAAPTKTDLEARFDAYVGAAMLAAFNSRYTQANTTIRYIDDSTDPPTPFTRAGVGAIATDAYFTDGCVSMLLKTALRGREFQGAKHFPALNEADTTGDVLTGAGLTRWQTLQATVFGNLVTALANVWTPVVFSRKESTLDNPTTIIFNDVTQVLLNKNIGTMRRRRIATVR
jgi:hypothetical protein